MKKYLLKILLWMYRDVIKDFTKVTVGEEFYLYKFGTPNDIVKLIKTLQTANIMWYYESKDDTERATVKGASMMLKIILDSHNQVLNIIEKESDEMKQLKLWDIYKRNNRTS